MARSRIKARAERRYNNKLNTAYDSLGTYILVACGSLNHEAKWPARLKLANDVLVDAVPAFAEKVNSKRNLRADANS